jgi:hypothetical protein
VRTTWWSTVLGDRGPQEVAAELLEAVPILARDRDAAVQVEAGRARLLPDDTVLAAHVPDVEAAEAG